MRATAALLVLALGTGCIHEPTMQTSLGGARMGATPQQVQDCKSTRTWHNAWVILGTIFGGLAGAGGGATTLTTDSNVQLGIGIGVIGAGLFASIATAAAGITADTFSQDNCQEILSTQ